MNKENCNKLGNSFEWNSCKLGQLVDKVGSGVTPKGGEESYVSSGVPLIRSQNVLWGRLDLSNVALIDEVQNHKMKSSKVLVDDVLLNITGASIGRACIVPAFVKQANVNQHVCIIRVNSTLDSKYLCGYLLSDYGQKQIDDFQAGGNREGLNFEQIKSFKIPLPPLPEQKRIVSVLETWDKAIELLTKKIEIKKKIKKGLMQELLTGKRRLKGFDGQWEKVNLKDICDLTMGQSPLSQAYNELGHGMPLIQGNNDIKNRKTVERIWTTEITKTAKKNDIILTVRAPVGLIALASTDVCIGRGVCSIRATKVDPNFLLKLLESYEDKWKAFEQGSTFTAVNSSDIRGLELFIPADKTEQKALGDTLTANDQMIAGYQSKLSLLQTQKKYLLNNLVTGKIRTPENLTIN